MHLGTDEVGHLRFGVEFVTIGTGDAAWFVEPLAFLTVFASLVVSVGGVVIVAHQRVSNTYISMHPPASIIISSAIEREAFFMRRQERSIKEITR